MDNIVNKERKEELRENYGRITGEKREKNGIFASRQVCTKNISVESSLSRKCLLLSLHLQTCDG